MERENRFEWEQFCRLGEMMGDGLHHEEPWIGKEYKKLLKILIPETELEKDLKKNARKTRNENIDKQIKELLSSDKCACGGDLQQSRSGSKVVKCAECDKRYRYKSKKV